MLDSSSRWGPASCLCLRYPVISSMEFFMRQRQQIVKSAAGIQLGTSKPFLCTHAEHRTIEKQKPDKSGKGMAMVLA